MIKIDCLTQVYPSGKGIFDISFEVKKGEVFGYLGPNGAGKTTTIRNILGFTNATKGSVTINGKHTRQSSAELQHLIGYLPGEIAFFDNMTGDEFLNFLCDMRALKDLNKRHRLLKQFELDTHMKIKKMSKGMKQKLAIVAAFMHDPDILILDEPTSGLDPLMQKKFMTLLNEEKQNGKTIIMSSHIFEEVNKICDRVGIIKDGKIVAIKDIAELKSMKQETFLIKTASPEAYSILKESTLLIEAINDTNFLVTITKDYTHLFQVLSKCQVIAMTSQEQSLENLFMKYYGKAVSNE